MVNHIILTVKARIQETLDTVTLIFNQTFNELPYVSGQFLTVELNINQELLRREYSFSSSPQKDVHLAVTVKRVKNGKVSNYLIDHLKIGDELKVLPATGTFVANLNMSNKRTLVMIAGGSGITPLYSMIKSILTIETQTKVYLIYASKHEDNIIFKNELEKLQQNYQGRFNHLNIISQASEKWFGLTGRINQENIINYLEQLPVIFPKEAEYFICAPSGLIKEIESGLRALKIPTNKIKKENFGIIENTTNNGISDQTVKVKYKNIEYDIFVPAGKSILKASLEMEIRLPFSCEKGVCTACMGTCKTGKVEMKGSDALSENELNKGYILTCISKPLSNDVFIDLD
jgi:ring-1,2-phenylacetyl-CoA epoxidase subunit PaaE